MFYTRVCGTGYDSGYRQTGDTLARAAARFGRPVLLLNGDSHVFVRDQPLPDVPNLTRIVVPGESDTHFKITDRDKAVLAQAPERVDNKLLLEFPEFQAFKRRRKPSGVAGGSDPVETAPDTGHVPVIGLAERTPLWGWHPPDFS